MEIEASKLCVFVEDETEIPSVGKVPLPTLSDVLYEPAIIPPVSPRGAYSGSKPTGRPRHVLALVGKRCDNCRLFAERENKCCIMGRQWDVTSDMVCGYHVGGDPQLYVTSLSGEGTLTPEQAGLMHAPLNGTTCDECRYYCASTDERGTCGAVTAEDGSTAWVDRAGCCARWRTKNDPDLPTVPATPQSVPKAV
jgi:hypothetical protein